MQIALPSHVDAEASWYPLLHACLGPPSPSPWPAGRAPVTLLLHLCLPPPTLPTLPLCPAAPSLALALAAAHWDHAPGRRQGAALRRLAVGSSCGGRPLRAPPRLYLGRCVGPASPSRGDRLVGLPEVTKVMLREDGEIVSHELMGYTGAEPGREVLGCCRQDERAVGWMDGWCSVR